MLSLTLIGAGLYCFYRAYKIAKHNQMVRYYARISAQGGGV